MIYNGREANTIAKRIKKDKDYKTLTTKEGKDKIIKAYILDYYLSKEGNMLLNVNDIKIL